MQQQPKHVSQPMPPRCINTSQAALTHSHDHEHDYADDHAATRMREREERERERKRERKSYFIRLISILCLGFLYLSAVMRAGTIIGTLPGDPTFGFGFSFSFSFNSNNHHHHNHHHRHHHHSNALKCDTHNWPLLIQPYNSSLFSLSTTCARTHLTAAAAAAASTRNQSEQLYRACFASGLALQSPPELVRCPLSASVDLLSQILTSLTRVTTTSLTTTSQFKHQQHTTNPNQSSPSPTTSSSSFSSSSFFSSSSTSSSSTSSSTSSSSSSSPDTLGIFQDFPFKPVTTQRDACLRPFEASLQSRFWALHKALRKFDHDKYSAAVSQKRHANQLQGRLSFATFMFLSPFKQMKKAINRICLQKILDTADLAVQSQLRIAEDLHTQARWIDREFNSIESVLLEFYAAYLPLRDLERGYIFDEDVVDIGPDPDVYNTNGRQERSHGSELQTRHEGQGGKQQQRLQYDQQQERRRLRQDQQQFQNNQQDQRDQYQQQQHQPRLLNNKLPPITIHGHSISYSSLSPRTIRRLNTFLRPSTDPLLHTHFSALTDSMRAQFPALRNRSDTDGETATHELRGGNHYPSIYLPAAFTGRRNATREVVRGDREVLCLMEGELRGAREGVRVLKEAVEEMDLIKVHEEVWGRGEGDTRRADMCTSEEEDIRDMFREMKASLKRALKRWKKEEEQKKTNPNLNLNRVEKELRRMFPFDAPPLLEKKA